ncbi:hypothetical protein [Nocardioides marinquilinus]
MDRTLELVIAVALVVGGLVLALGFADAEFLWFRGRPLGLVLAAIGVLDLVATLARRREG